MSALRGFNSLIQQFLDIDDEFAVLMQFDGSP
jgi:hypothetical protein